MNLNKLNFEIKFLSRVSNKERALIARQLATMLSSGLAIDQSFKILYAQTKNKALIRSYQSLITDLEQGNSLSVALTKVRNVFDPVSIAIIRSGENTGKLDKVFEQLADRLEMSEDFNNKIKGAMYYPIFVVCTMFVIIILMFVYIIPQLKTVFVGNSLTIPASTQLIISMSDFTVKFWWVEVLVIVLLGVGLYFASKSRKGGSLWDQMKIKLPIFKDLFVLIYMARFCRTMSMLSSAGLPIIETLAISADVIQNKRYTDSLRNIASQVERGIPISAPMSRDPLFPIMVGQMILVGEQTGKMSLVLDKLAQYYEKESDAKIKGLAGLIEPALIVFIGIGVGFLVYSVIYPIYSVAQTGF